MMLPVSFLLIAASSLIGLAGAERPLLNEDAATVGLKESTGGVSVRAAGGFQTAKRHIPESQVEASSLAETDDSEMEQKLKTMQEQLAIMNKEKAERDSVEPGPRGLGEDSGWKIAQGDRHKFTELPAGQDTPTLLMDKRAKHEQADLTSIPETLSEDGSQLTPMAGGLPVTGSYENLRKEMQDREELVFAKDFNVGNYNNAGSHAFIKNKDYHTKLANYVEKLFLMSRGAHQATAKEFNEHLSMASALGRDVHAGYTDLAGATNNDPNTFASELTVATGHASVASRDKLKAFWDDVINKGGDKVAFDREHIGGLHHGTRESRTNKAATDIANQHLHGARDIETDSE